MASMVGTSDAQVHNRQIKLLEFAPAGEPAGEAAGARAARRRRARAYKKALRIHQEHIRTGASAIIEDAQKNATEALTTGLTLAAPDRLEPEGRYFAQMNPNERVAFLRGLWNQDTFVSFLWSNWEDRVVRDMFQDKFVLLADAIVQYILTLRNITESCRHLSTSTFLRSSVKVGPDFGNAYAKFKSADRELGTASQPEGKHSWRACEAIKAYR
ncbi:hypothetical protein BKA63DRAFT_565863 [Paraphoma chrysanthemicola]|nr:hypothetical protein BKA63DRAFT_565863 [Paraphoma chrysanthemicola]